MKHQIINKTVHEAQPDIAQPHVLASAVYWESQKYGTHKLFPNDAMCLSKERQQFRFPRTKKVRIRKKWSKKSENFKWVEVRKIVFLGDKSPKPKYQ